MPRRGNEVITLPEPPKKKCKVFLEEPSSLEVSFCDDEALTSGLIFTDVQQGQWRIGKPIGKLFWILWKNCFYFHHHPDNSLIDFENNFMNKDGAQWPL